jgi:hypothetical protein
MVEAQTRPHLFRRRRDIVRRIRRNIGRRIGRRVRRAALAFEVPAIILEGIRAAKLVASMGAVHAHFAEGPDASAQPRPHRVDEPVSTVRSTAGVDATIRGVAARDDLADYVETTARLA